MFVLNNDTIILKNKIRRECNFDFQLQYIFEMNGYIKVSYRNYSNCGGVVLKELFGIKPGSFVLITYTYNNFIFDIYCKDFSKDKKYKTSKHSNGSLFFKEQILKQHAFRKIIKILENN